MPTVMVRVDDGLIEEGLPGVCFDCPVALAIDSVISEEYRAAVTPSGIGFYRYSELRNSDSGFVAFVNAPEIVLDFVARFDRCSIDSTRKIPGAFSFQLDVPDEIPIREGV